MSLPYPHDRARARQDEGEQPYKDAREEMGQKDAKLQNQAALLQGVDQAETDEERTACVESEAAARLEQVQDELADARGAASEDR